MCKGPEIGASLSYFFFFKKQQCVGVEEHVGDENKELGVGR
jgi:hypothetical protein